METDNAKQITIKIMETELLNNKIYERLKSQDPSISSNDNGQSTSKKEIPLSQSNNVQDATSTLEKILLMIAENQSRQHVDREMKPPSIEIEPFNGNIRNYRSFKDIFERAIAKTNWSKIEFLRFLNQK